MRMTMSEIELKPCPFCGGEAYYRTPTHLKGTAFDVMMVECKQCGASPYAVEVYECDTNENKRNAIAEFWNRRVDNVTEAIREFAEKLKALVNQKNYMLSDIHNSKDLGMFTLGFEQVIDEILEEMEKE